MDLQVEGCTFYDLVTKVPPKYLQFILHTHNVAKYVAAVDAIRRLCSNIEPGMHCTTTCSAYPTGCLNIC